MCVSALHIWIWGLCPILPCRFTQALSSWMGSVGERQSSSLSTDSQWDWSLGFGWGHSRTFTFLFWSHSSVALALCLGSLSCWNVNLQHSLRSFALWSRFSSRIYLYLAPFIVPSILTRLPVLATEKHPPSMMLPARCFTVGMVLNGWWAVLRFCQMQHFTFMPKSSIVVLSDHRIFCLIF